MGQEPKKLTPFKGGKHRFGAVLRRYRDLEELSIAALAQKINFSASYIGDVERGDSGCTRKFAEACDEALNTREALTHVWDALFSNTGNPLPNWFAEWPKTEAQAEVLWLYHPFVVHGLFQTAEYASTQLRDDQGLAEARMARQSVFARPDPPKVVYVLHELVLHHNIGGPEVMARQLDRLVELASPRVTVQVVPNGQIIPGNEGELMIATLEMGAEIGYVETAARGMILDAHRDVAQMKECFSDIRAHALPVEMSLDLIRRTKEQHWTT